MSNKYRNEVTVVLNGNEYTLRATFGALVAIEEALRMSFTKIQTVIFDQALTVKQGLIIFMTAARAAGMNIDEEQLRHDIEIGGVDDFGAALVAFMKIALFGSESLKKSSVAKLPSKRRRSIGSRISALWSASLSCLRKHSGR